MNRSTDRKILTSFVDLNAAGFSAAPLNKESDNHGATSTSVHLGASNSTVLQSTWSSNMSEKLAEIENKICQMPLIDDLSKMMENFVSHIESEIDQVDEKLQNIMQAVNNIESSQVNSTASTTEKETNQLNESVEQIKSNVVSAVGVSTTELTEEVAAICMTCENTQNPAKSTDNAPIDSELPEFTSRTYQQVEHEVTRRLKNLVKDKVLKDIDILYDNIDGNFESVISELEDKRETIMNIMDEIRWDVEKGFNDIGEHKVERITILSSASRKLDDIGNQIYRKIESIKVGEFQEIIRQLEYDIYF